MPASADIGSVSKRRFRPQFPYPRSEIYRKGLYPKMDTAFPF